MKKTLTLLLKFGITIAIFVGIFLEFGGGYAEVKTASLAEPGAIEVSNPAYPGIVGRIKAKLSGKELPPPRVPATIDTACTHAGEGAVFVRTADGAMKRIKTLRHCGDKALATLYVPAADGEFQTVPFADAPDKSFVRLQGFQLVPAELSDLWAEIRSVDPAVFLPWFLAAMAIKLVGIFANVWRWQILLQGQGIDLKFGFLTSTYFIGRYFGIVTPSTMGLDAWRIYETARLTKKPIECTTALAVERIIGLVGLLATILLFMPFAGRLMTTGQSFGELVGAMKVPLAGAMLFGILVLLQPGWFSGILRVIPHEKVRRFTANVIESATAYSQRRAHMLMALGLAIFGQITTTLMYFCNAMSIAAEGVHTSEVLFASAVMTLGTFLAPSASGEGVRELVFVYLLGGKVGAVKAFLIGNLGFWIEKVPLSIPGGIILLMRNDPTLHAVTREDLARVTGAAHNGMAAAPQTFCTKCGAARGPGMNFCTACGSPFAGPAGPAARPAVPAAAFVAGALLLTAGAVAAYFSLRGSTEVPRAVPGVPGAAATGSAAKGAAPKGEGLPSGHPSIELPAEVLAFLEGLAADAEKNPQSVDAAQKLARARYRASVINDSYRVSADQSLKKLLALDPANVEGLRISANLSYDAGEFAEAEKRFQVYLAKAPDDPSAITDLGSAQLFQNKLDDAVQSYRSALTKDPNFMQAHFNLGIALEKQGKKDEAIASLKRALDHAESADERQHVENALAELEGRKPMQIAGAKSAAPAAAANAATSGAATAAARGGTEGSAPASGVASGSGSAPAGAGSMQGGMPMPPPAPDRDVPTSASSDFQRQAEKPLITHPMIGPRLVAFEWSGPATMRAKIADFPMDQMPPFARAKFKSSMTEKIAAIAKQNGVAGAVKVELVDAATGRVMENLDTASGATAPATPTP